MEWTINNGSAHEGIHLVSLLVLRFDLNNSYKELKQISKKCFLRHVLRKSPLYLGLSLFLCLEPCCQFVLFHVPMG